MMTFNIHDLKDNPQELVEKLALLQAAGLQVQIQIKGNQEQTMKLLNQLPSLQGSSRRWPRLMGSLVPAAAGSLAFIVLGLTLWV